MQNFIKAFNDSEARDDHGRWTAGGDAAVPQEEEHRNFQRATVRPGDGDAVRQPARGVFAAAMRYLDARARDLAGKVKQVVGSTRFAGVSPLPSGGIEIRSTHTLPNGAPLAGYAQIHPYMVKHGSGPARALATAHAVLTANGVPVAALKHPAVGVTWRNSHGRTGRA